MIELVTALILVGQAATPPPAEDKDPIICSKRSTSDVGTHMAPKRVCMRKSDWDIIERKSRDELQSLHDKHLDPGRAEGHGPSPR